MDLYVPVRTLKFCQGWLFLNSLLSKSFPVTTVFTHFETHTPKNEVRKFYFLSGKWWIGGNPLLGGGHHADGSFSTAL